MVDYEEFRWACEQLNIQIPITYSKIRKRYLQFIKKLHPDQSSSKENEKLTADLIHAWEIIESYCENFKYEFSEDEFFRQYPNEKLKKRLSEDPLWN